MKGRAVLMVLVMGNLATDCLSFQNKMVFTAKKDE
jgi:hypothetical protein